MTIRSLFALTCLTTALACGGDDGGDDAADSGSDSTVSTTMTTTESTTMTTTESTTMTTTVSTTDTTETGDTGTETGDSGTDTGPEDSGTTEAAGSCAEYCALYLANCAEGQGGSDTYPNEMACLNACAEWDEGTPGDMNGDTVQCRIWHAEAAGDDPGTHCLHSQENPDGGCV